MSQPWISNVYQFQDGVDNLSAGSVNPVINSLANRDQYLYDQLQTALSQNLLVSLDQPFATTYANGTPVYFNTSSGTPILTAALSTYQASSTDGHMFPAQSAFVFGLIKQTYAGAIGGVNYGDVYLRGLITDASINYVSLLDTPSAAEIGSGSIPPGPLFLSGVDAGCLSIFPASASVLIGYYLGGSNFILAPNINSLNELYFNYRMYLNPNPAGTAVLTASGGTTWTITSPNLTQLGWITTQQANSLLGINPPYTGGVATATVNGSGVVTGITVVNGGANYLTAPTITISGGGTGATATATVVNGVITVINVTNGGSGYSSATPPTVIISPGVQFYYNIPTDANITALINSSTITSKQGQDAMLLKRALPAYPTAYTMLFVNGVLQTQFDGDHPTGAYLVNEDGIWWTNDTTGYLPWGGGLNLELFITKLNPNLGSSIVTSLTAANQSVTITDSIGQPASTGDLSVALNLNTQTVTNVSGSGTTIQSLSFDPTSGLLTVNTAPVINSISTGPGLNLSLTSGVATLSLSNFALSGEVTDLEPQEAILVYKGLNSYLRLIRPQPNQQVGFIGRFMVPSNIPAGTSITFGLIGFTDASSATGVATIGFEFDYLVTNTGSSISTAQTSSTLSIPGASFPALSQATITLNSSNQPYFNIASGNFTAGSYVNFRIARTYTTTDTYANPIGILGVLWSIG